ncbi:MAG: putative transcriptional regulator, TetR family [Actinomycetia bacterium]|nr:putative transcriptional regulator, TetR family [Actinomycetes bacterium]
MEQRRNEILEAARAVVLERGLANTRVADVADALNVSTGLIHYHFASKDELFAETLRHAAATDIHRLEKSVASSADPVERLDRVLREYLPSPRGDQTWQLWIDTWSAGLRNSVLRDISEELDEAWVRVLQGVIEAGVDAGAFTCPDPRASAWRLSSLLDGLGLQVVVHRKTMRRSQMLEHARIAAAHEVGLDRSDFPTTGR